MNGDGGRGGGYQHRGYRREESNGFGHGHDGFDIDLRHSRRGGFDGGRFRGAMRDQPEQPRPREDHFPQERNEDELFDNGLVPGINFEKYQHIPCKVCCY